MTAKVQEFHPVIMSRQGEAASWGIWAAVTLAWIWLARVGSTSLFVPVFWAVLTVIALGTSLGNWMDRRTILRIADDGVFFANGLRTVSLPWEDIQRIEVLPSRWGEVVHVWGPNAHFRFRTLAEVQAIGKDFSTRVGFPGGKRIVQEMCQRSGLHVEQQTDNGRRYYARE